MWTYNRYPFCMGCGYLSDILPLYNETQQQCGCHDVGNICVLLASNLNSPVTGGFPWQRTSNVALMLSLLLVWTRFWVNNSVVGALSRGDAQVKSLWELNRCKKTNTLSPWKPNCCQHMSNTVCLNGWHVLFTLCNTIHMLLMVLKSFST